MRTNPTKKHDLAETDQDDWLTVLCRYARWTERELLSVLADVPPAASKDAPPKTRQQQNDDKEPERREAVRRHADDAIEEKQLRVTLKLHPSDVDQLQDAEQRARFVAAAYANAIYDTRYTVRPTVAIRWFQSHRALFPDCRLAAEHLAIAEREDALLADSTPTLDPLAVLTPPSAAESHAQFMGPNGKVIDSPRQTPGQRLEMYRNQSVSSAKNIDVRVQFRRLLVPARIRGATLPESEPRRRDGRRGFDGHSTAARPHQTARQEYRDRD